MPRPDHTAELTQALEKRILVLDGAMGTTIRGYGLEEKDARGDRFKDTEKDLLNNGDILSLTRPDVIADIHKRFLLAGSDIFETNTFSGTSIAQSEFFVEDPRESGAGRKDPEFYQKVLDDSFLKGLAAFDLLVWPTLMGILAMYVYAKVSNQGDCQSEAGA